MAVCELDPRTVDPDRGLLAEERTAIARAIESRRLQYTAGRVCARDAMRALGEPLGPVLAGEDRAPTFPDGLVGTITHTQWWGAAALARAETHAALGIDVEPDTPLKAQLFSSVLTPDEQRELELHPEPLRGLFGKLIFSAKECAYKCQYTVSRTFYGFHGMRIELPPGLSELPEDGTFRAIFLRDAGEFRTGDAIEGRFVRAAGYVMTGAELLRDSRGR